MDSTLLVILAPKEGIIQHGHKTIVSYGSETKISTWLYAFFFFLMEKHPKEMVDLKT